MLPHLLVREKMESFPHQSVLLDEVLQVFDPLSIRVLVDCTLGAGGHAQAILERHPEIQSYVGIDQDPQALEIAKKRLHPWEKKVIFKGGNFDQIETVLKEYALTPDAILADLGVSSMQLDQPLRGFSFMQEGPLDMRMDPHLEITAAEIVNSWSEKELGKIFRDYGEEKQWKLAARTIVKARGEQPLTTTTELKKVLVPVLSRYSKKGIHPLTLVFQALRICVNRELEVLENFLPKAIDLLVPGGRLAVISFHSLEDRIVKNHFRLSASDKWESTGLGGLFRDKEPEVKLVTKKPIGATPEEVQKNPRSRSAKLRVVEKLEKKSAG